MAATDDYEESSNSPGGGDINPYVPLVPSSEAEIKENVREMREHAEEGEIVDEGGVTNHHDDGLGHEPLVEKPKDD